MSLPTRVLLTVILAGGSLRAAKADFDVRPVVIGGQIITDGHDDGTGENVTDRRVFDYAFQQDPADPFFTSDPGFNAEAGSGLPGGSQLRFNVVDAATFGLPANLSYWDGSDSNPIEPGVQPLFTHVPAGESLTWMLGSSSLTVGNTIGNQPGFLIQNVLSGLAEGAVHKHVSAFLNGSGGNDPSEGFYLFPIELTDSAASIQKSKPFFILYSNIDPDNSALSVLAEVAYDYVATQVVPEPSTLVLAGFGAAAVIAASVRSRRREKR